MIKRKATSFTFDEFTLDKLEEIAKNQGRSRVRVLETLISDAYVKMEMKEEK
jgi:predicted transcriptional regulator